MWHVTEFTCIYSFNFFSPKILKLLCSRWHANTQTNIQHIWYNTYKQTRSCWQSCMMKIRFNHRNRANTYIQYLYIYKNTVNMCVCVCIYTSMYISADRIFQYSQECVGNSCPGSCQRGVWRPWQSRRTRTTETYTAQISSSHSSFVECGFVYLIQTHKTGEDVTVSVSRTTQTSPRKKRTATEVRTGQGRASLTANSLTDLLMGYRRKRRSIRARERERQSQWGRERQTHVSVLPLQADLHLIWFVSILLNGLQWS